MNRKYVRWCCGAACVLLLGWGAQVWADETVPDTDESVVAVVDREDEAVPAYQNAAQAAHDANLAEAAYEKIDAEMAALEHRLTAEEAKDPAEQDSALIDQLNSDLVELAAQRTGIEQGDIAQMRADGMGWGEIAHALGVHPGVLGLGHSKKSTAAGVDDELAMATAVDMKNGNGMGHGKSSNSSSGMGKGNNGNGGQSGGKDKGDKGNNGNGNSRK